MKLLNLLEHNPRHYTQIKNYKLCSRCLGMYTAGVISFIIFAILSLYIHLGFWEVFITSWILASFCIIDWSFSKIKILLGKTSITHVTTGNKNRLITGALLGVGISFYFWVLPSSWLFRLLSLWLYGLIFFIVTFMVNYHEMKNGLLELSEEFFKKSENQVFECCCLSCCGATCCMGKICCMIGAILCCCCCPILILLLLFKKI